MTVGLDEDLLPALIESRGGVTKLLHAWEDRYGVEGTPDRQTVYNWQAGKLPDSSIRLIRLAHLLDVDPFCLLKPESGTAAQAIGDIFHSYQLDLPSKKGLKFIGDFFGWKPVWPPPDFQLHFRKKPSQREAFLWHTEDFAHDPELRSSYYPTIVLTSDPEVINTRPQTFHFAYSGKAMVQDRWLQYGVVVRHQDRVRLYHIHGHTEECTTASVSAPTLVETWFGPGSATFRVASRHPFTLEVREAADGGRVRFLG